jgi:hypothetical protein
MYKATPQEVILAKKMGKVKSVETFWMVCPYSINELNSKNKKKEFAIWRQIGMAWYRLAGKSLESAGKSFERNHATVIHAVNVVNNALDGFYPEMMSKLKLVIEADKTNLRFGLRNPLLESHSLVKMEQYIAVRKLISRISN